MRRFKGFAQITENVVHFQDMLRETMKIKNSGLFMASSGISTGNLEHWLAQLLTCGLDSFILFLHCPYASRILSEVSSTSLCLFTNVAPQTHASD